MDDTTKCILVCTLLTTLTASSLVNGFSVRSSKQSSVQSGKGNFYEERLFFNDQVPAKISRARMGQSVTLHCSAGGSPSPTIHWLYKGSRVPQGVANFVMDDEAVYETSGLRSNQPTLRLGGTKSRLFIDCVSPDDVGEYTCVAESPTQRISTKTVLEIENTIATDFVDSCIRKRLHAGKPARVFMWTVQRLEFEGADVQLFCRASGTPEPRITWFDKSGQPITENDRQYTLLENGDILIRGINWEDNMGSYQCEADNGHGRDKVSIFLYPTYP